MKFRPILFSTPMVESILDGSKTQTRRKNFKADVGDILWVRETWQVTDWLHPSNDEYGYIYKASNNGKEWEQSTNKWKWKPSIFMPKNACRIFLEVTEKRIELLQNISEEDIYAEGVKISTQLEFNGKNTPAQFLDRGYMYHGYSYEEKRKMLALAHWASLWSTINGRKSWEENPEINAYTFKRIDCPSSFI